MQSSIGEGADVVQDAVVPSSLTRVTWRDAPAVAASGLSAHAMPWRLLKNGPSPRIVLPDHGDRERVAIDPE